MTREEQIVEAGKTAAGGKEFSVLVNKQNRTMSAYEIGFIEGAEWADSHPAWVSVEERLPKERGKLYLVCDKYGRVGESAYDVEDDIWYRQSGMVLNPTHWMQLPQPPVKKGGNDAS